MLNLFSTSIFRFDGNWHCIGVGSGGLRRYLRFGSSHLMFSIHFTLVAGDLFCTRTCVHTSSLRQDWTNFTWLFHESWCSMVCHGVLIVFLWFSMVFNCFLLFFHCFFKDRIGNPLVFIVGCPSMNSLMDIIDGPSMNIIEYHWWTINEFIDGPSMNMVPFLWFPFFGPFFGAFLWGLSFGSLFLKRGWSALIWIMWCQVNVTVYVYASTVGWGDCWVCDEMLHTFWPNNHKFDSVTKW